MSATGMRNLDSAVQKFNLWLKELDNNFSWDNRHKSYKALQVVLHAVRDNLTINQSAHFSAQLPMIARGLYYDGWVPSRVPLKERRLEQFYDHIRENFDQGPGGDNIDPEWICRTVFELLNNHVSAGEIADIRSELPGAVRRIWPEPGAENGRARPQG